MMYLALTNPIMVIGEDGSLDVMDSADPRLADLIRRHDASNSPVDETPALPPAPDMARLFADPPSWGANAGPKPPPAGKPGRRRTSSWRIETPEQRAEKRAKRKAAEKSRRRNRK